MYKIISYFITEKKKTSHSFPLVFLFSERGKMKVRAKQGFEFITDSTIGRVRKNGEIFEVDEDRAKLLLKHDLIEVIEEAKEEEPKVEIKDQTPKKTKKKTKKQEKDDDVE